jgi:hypothetical protein
VLGSVRVENIHESFDPNVFWDIEEIQGLLSMCEGMLGVPLQ